MLCLGPKNGTNFSQKPGAIQGLAHAILCVRNSIGRIGSLAPNLPQKSPKIGPKNRPEMPFKQDTCLTSIILPRLVFCGAYLKKIGLKMPCNGPQKILENIFLNCLPVLPRMSHPLPLPLFRETGRGRRPPGRRWAGGSGTTAAAAGAPRRRRRLGLRLRGPHASSPSGLI